MTTSFADESNRVQTEFSRNVNQLFEMVWGKGQPIKNIELADLVESTRVSYLMLNKTQKFAFNQSPTWLLDSLDLIEDSMGVRDEYTAASLMFKSAQLPKLDEVHLGLSQVNSVSSAKLNKLQDCINELDYGMYSFSNSGDLKSVEPSVKEIISLLEHGNITLSKESDDSYKHAKDLKAELEKYESGKATLGSVRSQYANFKNRIESPNPTKGLGEAMSFNDSPDYHSGLEKTSQFSNSLIAAINKESNYGEQKQNTKKKSINTSPTSRKF